MRILYVAADPLEFRGMLARASDVRPSDAPARFARAATIAGNPSLLVANGMGRRRAAAAMAAADGFRPDAVVSTGFCGALDEAYEIADVVAATSILSTAGEYRAHPVDAPRSGPILSIDRVAQTAAEKRKYRETGACAVEMEAAAVAAAAQTRGIPFYCIRVVTDLGGESLVNDFNRALREDGHLDTMIILRGALCRPASRLPELLRLRRRCVRAAEALGEFIAGCRFQSE
jgi:adenosylhomocysteine nucleosidase